MKKLEEKIRSAIRLLFNQEWDKGGGGDTDYFLPVRQQKAPFPKASTKPTAFSRQTLLSS